MEPIPMAPIRVDAPPAAPTAEPSVNGVSISAQDIAAAVVYTLTQPPHVTISQLVIVPDN